MNVLSKAIQLHDGEHEQNDKVHLRVQALVADSAQSFLAFVLDCEVKWGECIWGMFNVS